MDIYEKYISADNINIGKELANKFKEKDILTVKYVPTTLFSDSEQELYGKLIKNYDDNSLSFYIALIKKDEKATIINKDVHFDSIAAPAGYSFLNQIAVIYIQNNLIYFCGINRFNVQEIMYFIRNILNTTVCITWSNVAETNIIEKIQKFGVNRIELDATLNYSYLKMLEETQKSKRFAVIRDAIKFLSNTQLTDREIRQFDGLKTKLIISKGSIKADKDDIQNNNCIEESMIENAKELCEENEFGGMGFTIKLKGSGGAIRNKDLLIKKSFGVKYDCINDDLITKINEKILDFKQSRTNTINQIME